MNTILLIFFAIPIAVIIISIALQKIFKCPFIVAAIIFAIFLIIPFILGNLNLLVATIAYTMLSFITALLTNVICKILRELDDRECNNSKRCNCRNKTRNSNNNEIQLLSITGDCSDSDNNGNLLTISSNGCNGIENELLTINSSCGNNNDNNNTCSCNCNTSDNSIAVRANVFPNNSTNGRTGSFCGCFRRR